jgi:hypothetical protein
MAKQIKNDPVKEVPALTRKRQFLDEEAAEAKKRYEEQLKALDAKEKILNSAPRLLPKRKLSATRVMRMSGTNLTRNLRKNAPTLTPRSWN